MDVEVTTNTDTYPEETTWTLSNECGSGRTMSGGPYSQKTLCTWSEIAFLLESTVLPLLTLRVMGFVVAMELVGTILSLMESPPTLVDCLEYLKLKHLANVL